MSLWVDQTALLVVELNYAIRVSHFQSADDEFMHRWKSSLKEEATSVIITEVLVARGPRCYGPVQRRPVQPSRRN